MYDSGAANGAPGARGSAPGSAGGAPVRSAAPAPAPARTPTPAATAPGGPARARRDAPAHAPAHTPPHTRAHTPDDRRARAAAPESRPVAESALGTAGRISMLRYEPYLDGLFTYCLSVMCEHDAAVTALGEALVLAERQRERGRAPAQRGLLRPWLYALARWACLRRLAERSRREGTRNAVPATAPHLPEAARTQRRRELAALAWPEAAGTTPEQREALELAVRHGLPAHEVAAVLALAPEAAGALLSHAACEVERTRAALAVVESGGCAAVSRLAGDDQLLLGTAFRRELVHHVDECAVCRRAAERAMAGVPWPGTAPAGTGELAVLEAPRAAVEAAVLAVRRARSQHAPRFDRAGFPVEARDRGARRERLRSRALTTTVVATVVAAPVLALWAAYRGAPMTGEAGGSGVSSSEREDGAGIAGTPYENAAQGSPRGTTARQRVDGGRAHGADGRHRAEDEEGRKKGGHEDGEHRAGASAGAGRLVVDARSFGRSTVIRLTAEGGSPVRWSAYARAPWLSLSRTSGVLESGESTVVRVAVDHEREPGHPWAARIRIGPGGAVVTVQGRGTGTQPPPDGGPGTPPAGDPPTTTPSDPPPSDPPAADPPPSEPPPAP